MTLGAFRKINDFDRPYAPFRYRRWALSNSVPVCYPLAMTYIPDQSDIAKGLLGRGGSALIIATIARSRGIRMGERQWSVLAPDTIASVEQVLGFLDQETAMDWVEMAVHQALIGDPIASIPSWLRPIGDIPDALSAVGRATELRLVAPALGPNVAHPSDRAKGMAAVAVALSRMQDTLDTLSRILPDEDGCQLVRMGRLAAATVRAGEPTRMRAHIREKLKEFINGKSYQGRRD